MTGRQIVVDDVLGRDIHTISKVALRDDKINLCHRSDGARPGDIECGLIDICRDARVVSVNDDLGIVRGKPEKIAEIANVLNVDVAATDDGDRLACAVNSSVIERLHVIDLGEVGGSHAVRTIVEGELAACLFEVHLRSAYNSG